MVASDRGRVLWILLPVLLVATLVTASLSFSAPAPASETTSATDEGPSLAEHFPPGTLAVMRSNETEKTLEWMSNSAFASLVADPEVKPLWAQVTGMVKNFNDMALQRVGVDFLDMLSQIKGKHAVGLTRVMMTTRGPRPGVMIALDCASGADKFKEGVATLMKLIPEGALEEAKREVAGVAVRSFAAPKDNEQRRNPLREIGTIHMAWVDSILVLANDKSGFDSFIRVSRGEELKTLGETDNWKETMEKIGGKGDFTFYVNIHAVAEFLENMAGGMPEEVGPILSALGLDQFPSMGISTFLEKNAVSSNFLLRYTGDGKSGIGSLFAFKKADLTIPSWVPDDAMQVMVFNYDFEKAFAGVLGLVQEAGDEPYEGMQEGLEEFDKEFGVSLQDELIPALAGPVIMVQYVPIGKETVKEAGRKGIRGFNPMDFQAPTLIGIRIKNRKPIEKVLEYLEDMGAEVTEYQGATIFSIPALDDNMPTTEVGITDSYVLFGIGSAPMVRQTLQRMGGQESGFGGRPGVRDALAELPKEGAGLFVANYGKSLSMSVNMLKLLGSVADLEALSQFPIPSSEIFEKYFHYSAGVMTYEPGVGVIIKSRVTLGK